MTRTQKRVALVVFVAVMVVAAVIVQNMVAPAQGTEDGGRVDDYTGQTSLDPPTPLGMALVSNLVPRGPADGVVKTYKATVYMTTPQQQLAGGFRRTAKVTLNGGNAIDKSVIRAALTVHWSYDGKRVWDVNYNFWGDADMMWLWSYNGAKVVANGSGTGPYGEYKYRRVQYDFDRALQGWGQHVYPWLSMTVRANGSCAADRIDHAGEVSCQTGGTW